MTQAELQPATDPPTVRLRDGRLLSYDDILAIGHPAIVELASCEPLPSASEQDLLNIASLPLTMGDDTLDVVMGAWNIARNSRLTAHPDPSQCTTAPAIVIGSGPSLDEWIPKLRQTYGSYLLVAAASAVRKLVDNGIQPHVVAPKERTRYPEWCFQGLSPDARYGGLLVVPDVAQTLPHAWCVGDGDPINHWVGVERKAAAGPTSGTHAVSLALDITSGPVYLIGMDNCGGHYAGYPGTEHVSGDMVMCYDGVERSSNWLYRVARANIERKAFGRCTQLSPTAAIIPGISVGSLSDGASFTLPDLTPTRHDRMRGFHETLKRLPDDWTDLWGCTQSAQKLTDTHLERITSPNRILFRAMQSPLVAQLSMERRMGMSDPDVLEWYREAWRNMHDCLDQHIHEMAACGDKHYTGGGDVTDC